MLLVMAASSKTSGPAVLGPYKILARIGRDTSGGIYRACDKRVDRTVLIKVIPADPEQRDALVRSAGAAASFSHPIVACLLEITEDHDAECLYLVSENVPGDTLRSALAARRYSPRRSLGFAIQLADAVADAHAVDLIHGNLKPENIVLTSKGDGKILHFGLATARPADDAWRTDACVAPERILGKSIDHRTDVFALAAILFEMLTGRPPMVGVCAADEAEPTKIDLELPAGCGPRVLNDLRSTLASALARNPNARCGSAAAFAAELKAVAAIMDLQRSVQGRVHERYKSQFG
jgi:serine/threonine protein kinase